MYRYIRHPNYLGEMMLYGSFALMVWHWLPFVVLAWIWGGMFVVNMTLKETSMSRYPEWAEYKRRSWWLLPRLRLSPVNFALRNAGAHRKCQSRRIRSCSWYQELYLVWSTRPSCSS